MGKQIMVDGKLLNIIFKKKLTTFTCYDMDKTWKHYAKWRDTGMWSYWMVTNISKNNPWTGATGW